MKKLFLLIPALLLTLAMNAKEIQISSATSNILGVTVNGSGSEDGDVIILTDNGPYVNVWAAEGKGDDYTRLEKNLTIKAAEGKSPVIKYTVPFRSRYGKTVKFIGIKFDGTEMSNYDYYFLVYNNADNNLEFENCEFTGMSKYLFYVSSGNKAHSIVLNNCSIHDNTNRIVYNSSATIDNLSIVDSEISNSSHYIIHNNSAQMGTCTITNCDIHGCARRAILNEAGTIDNIAINNTKIYNFTGETIIDNYSASTIGKLKINDTEFYGNTKDIISGTATSHADSCIINNCYFHNNSRSAIYFPSSTVEGVETCDGVIVKNSTFANNDLSASSRSVIDVLNYGETQAANIEVTVDHCTFYNNSTNNYDYSCIRSKKSTKVNITNSIFAYPSAIEFYATNCYGGTISNTIVYNLNKGHRSSSNKPALTNTTTVDPRFNDLANNNYTFNADWSTGSISPAWKSASDGSSLGDPRWYRDNEVIPSSSIASTYELLSTKAQLTGDVKLNASDYIEYKGTSTPGTAKWKLHVDRACIISAVVDRAAGNVSGCKLTLTVKDADGNEVGALAMTSGSYNDDDINLPGTITFSEAGDYTFVLTNSTSGSASILEKIILSYFGGAVQTIATDENTTLNVADAWFHTSGSRSDGKITYSSWNSDNSWVKWNATLSESKFFDVSLRISTDNAHHCALAVYEDEAASPVATLQESYTEESEAVTRDIPLGRISLTKDKQYVLKVTNPVSGSRAKIVSLTFAPVVASATELPNTLEFSNAVLSEKANITDGMLYFNEPGADKDPRGQWARWNVTTDHDGLFLFTMGTNSSNGQNYKISILDDSEHVIDSCQTTSLESGAKTIKHYFDLAAGDYSVKVENTRSYSKGHLTSLVVTEPGDVITIDEKATTITSWEDQLNVANVDVKILRTLKGGMYNTLVLPFAISSDQAKEIFGESVEMYTLKEATVEDDYILNLELKSESSTYQGTPIFIKPANDVENPIFIDVTIKTTTVGTTTKTNANFAGTFVKTTLGPDQDILFLAQDNMLYYPAVDIEILGMRGWFVIHDTPAPAPQITRARIINNEHVATEIELVGNTLPTEFGDNKVTKRIDDGQLLIIRDGAIYNALGVRIK